MTDISRCPMCGNPTESFTTRCICGFEFRAVAAERTISELHSAIQEVYQQHDADDTDAITRRIVQIISTFPVPNSKEALLEFLAQSFSKAHTNSKWSWFSENSYEQDIRAAWRSKSAEVIMKIRLSLGNDRDLMGQVEMMAKKLGIE